MDMKFHEHQIIFPKYLELTLSSDGVFRLTLLPTFKVPPPSPPPPPPPGWNESWGNAPGPATIAMPLTTPLLLINQKFLNQRLICSLHPDKGPENKSSTIPQSIATSSKLEAKCPNLGTVYAQLRLDSTRDEGEEIMLRRLKSVWEREVMEGGEGRGREGKGGRRWSVRCF